MGSISDLLVPPSHLSHTGQRRGRRDGGSAMSSGCDGEFQRTGQIVYRNSACLSRKCFLCDGCLFAAVLLYEADRYTILDFPFDAGLDSSQSVSSKATQVRVGSGGATSFRLAALILAAL